MCNYYVVNSKQIKYCVSTIIKKLNSFTNWSVFNFYGHSLYTLVIEFFTGIGIPGSLMILCLFPYHLEASHSSLKTQLNNIPSVNPSLMLAIEPRTRNYSLGPHCSCSYLRNNSQSQTLTFAIMALDCEFI